MVIRVREKRQNNRNEKEGMKELLVRKEQRMVKADV